MWYEMSFAFDTREPIERISSYQQMEVVKAIIAAFAANDITINFIDTMKVVPCRSEKTV